MAHRSGNSTATYDPRQIWTMNLAPLVVAAREGAAQAARTASRERARVRQQPAWWRQRWVMATAAGVAAAGVAGGVYAATRHRRTSTGWTADTGGHGIDGMPASHERPDGLKSSMDTGRAKVSDMARNVAHRIRGNQRDDYGPERSRMAGAASTRTDESRNQLHHTETGYQGLP